MRLTDAHILVTGGGSGIGRAIVDRLVSEGSLATVIDVNPDALEQLKQEQPGVTPYQADLTDHEQVRDVISRIQAECGPIQALVNNAGVIHSEPLISIGMDGLKQHSLENWRRILAVDLDSVFFVTREVAGEMVKKRIKGVVVNVSSIAAVGNAGQTAYSAAKAAVNALTVTWARELGAFGIRVAGLAPGFTDTPSTHAALTDSTLQHIRKEVPLRRLAKPAEMAQGVVSILENSFYTGRILELDGGLRL